MIRESIIKLSKKQDLTYQEAEEVMDEIMSGKATPVQMSAYLTALALKGETIDEITASAAGMRAHCIKLLHDMDVLEIVGTGGDGSNSFNISTTASLRLGLVPDGYEDKVFANVVEKTEKDCKRHVSAGVLGIQHLMRGLTEYGGLELAYKIVTNDTYPSWGYMIKKGATTIWELWNGDTANPAMNSRNHVMLLGDLLIWFYEDLAGIKNTPASVGFKQILMEPVFPEKLNYVNASHVSPYGRIGSSWKRDGNKLEWNVEIPANTTATVKLPLDFHVQVDAGQAGIHSVEEADGKLVVELGSGKYVFMSE